MPQSSPKWRWTTDSVPGDLEVVWIRPLSLANKPVLAQYTQATNNFHYEVAGINFDWNGILVPQWRPQ
jgi:hypothetical protein